MAYHKAPLSEGDKEKTAFATPRGGLYQYVTMPFGLCNAAGTFQRIIEKALTNLQWHPAVQYLDDIVVFGKTFEEHFKNLNEVMDRLTKAGLKLKPKKCHFLKKINFPGHVVSKEGIQTDPEKTKAIDQIRIPSSVKDVRSFLGLACYYRKFVKDYSKYAKPLYDLTKQDKKWLWTDDCQRAFEELKSRLTSAPILAYPNMEGEEFVLDTDASAFAIGAVLSQKQDGKERVIA